MGRRRHCRLAGQRGPAGQTADERRALAQALGLSVAVAPVGPALQRVAEPARQAVTSLVQPTSDAVTVFFGGGAPMVHVEDPTTVSSPSRAAAFSDVVSLDVTIEDAP